MAYFTEPMGDEFRKAIEEALREVEVEKNSNSSVTSSIKKKKKNVKRDNGNEKVTKNKLPRKVRRDLR